MSTPSALLFPGQGSQEPGMGRDVAEASAEAMEFWKKAERISGLPLREIYWESEDPALMADTRHLQPALTVVNLNLWRELACSLGRSGLSVFCAAGHSLGEYSALAAAGVLSPEKVLELVALRGRLMADADPEARGAMAAVLKLDRAAVENIAAEAADRTGQLLLVVNHNTPVQFVVSGSRSAVDAAVSLVKERKGRAVPLAVSGAFHTPLMEAAGRELGAALSKATWNRPRFPVYSNVTGRAVADGESLKELSMRQMTSPVLWIDTVVAQRHDGCRAWIEVGPKGVLSRMVKPILAAVPEAEEPVVYTADSLDAVRQLTS